MKNRHTSSNSDVASMNRKKLPSVYPKFEKTTLALGRRRLVLVEKDLLGSNPLQPVLQVYNGQIFALIALNGFIRLRTTAGLSNHHTRWVGFKRPVG